jgi:(p)ppGpp synthase/HD superfamily hydrolase
MMQKFKTLDDVIALATFAHRNQHDKAGIPYIEHPLRVMKSVQQQGAMPYVQMAAVLHDVTEDTAFTSDMLLELGVPEAAVEIVKLMDRDRSQSIWENFGDHELLSMDAEGDINMTKDEYYYACIRQNPGALMVKLADIDDNTQQWRLSYLPEDTQNRLKAKYDKARKELTSPVVRVFDQW